MTGNGLASVPGIVFGADEICAAAPVPSAAKAMSEISPARIRIALRPSLSRSGLKPFDDADVALRAAAEHFQRGLIARAVMGGGGLFDAVEFDDDDALHDALLIGFCGVAASNEFAAAGGDCRPGELGVFGQSVRIGNGKICRYPIGLGHGCLPMTFAL